jgi:hypothetical protein
MIESGAHDRDESAAGPGPQAAALPQPGGDAEPLNSRPRFSVRNLIASGFALCFILALAVNFLWILTAFRIQEKLHFLEIADSYLFEIQQARRYEKNFFLYQTGLDEALEHMRVAHGLLMANSEQLRSVIGETRFETMRPRSEKYLELLEDLSAAAKAGRASPPEVADDEADIRTEGASVVQFATDLVARERQSSPPTSWSGASSGRSIASWPTPRASQPRISPRSSPHGGTGTSSPTSQWPSTVCPGNCRNSKQSWSKLTSSEPWGR